MQRASMCCFFTETQEDMPSEGWINSWAQFHGKTSSLGERMLEGLEH